MYKNIRIPIHSNNFVDFILIIIGISLLNLIILDYQMLQAQFIYLIYLKY